MTNHKIKIDCHIAGADLTNGCGIRHIRIRENRHVGYDILEYLFKNIK